jgi:hypothetical protein
MKTIIIYTELSFCKFNTCGQTVIRLTAADVNSPPSGEVKVKVKMTLCLFLPEHHAMKAYWGNEGIAPLIL